MALTDSTIKPAKPKGKDYKLSDEKGLFLLVKKTGAKYWRLKLRFARKKLLALGVYPEVSLKEARNARDDARTLLRNGTDPSAAKRVQKASQHEAATNSLAAIALEWLDKKVRIPDQLDHP